MLEYPMLTLLVIAPFAEKVQQAERQRQAVEAIREAGAFLLYDYQWDVNYTTDQETATPVWHWRLLGEDFLADVVGVGFLREQVGNGTLRNLNGLTRMHTLHIVSTQVTDAGLENLTGLTNLERLYLHSTQVTDAGLEHLKELTKLKRLSIYATHVTEEGINKLQKALPDCEIDWRRIIVQPQKKTGFFQSSYSQDRPRLGVSELGWADGCDIISVLEAHHA